MVHVLTGGFSFDARGKVKISELAVFLPVVIIFVCFTDPLGVLIARRYISKLGGLGYKSGFRSGTSTP